MSASTNINKVYFNGKTSAYAERVLYQWDYGQVLQFPDLELPAVYQVHFSTAPTAGSAYDMLGTADGVSIPDTLLEEGKPIYAWIFLHAGEDDGETVRVAVIYVKPRSKSISETPTPAQQSAWDEAISALSAALEEAQALAEAIPEEIDSALAAAKASGEFDGEDGTDGNSIWWTVSLIDDESMPGQVYGKIRSSWLKGRSGAPAVHDLVVGPAVGTSGNIEWLYEIIAVSGIYCNLHGIGSIKGAPGDPGEDGFAPEVTIEQIDGGHRVTITSAAHPEGQSFDVMDGERGPAGPSGGQFWTAQSASTSPDYTWSFSNLIGPDDETPAVGDIIFYSIYRYTVASVDLQNQKVTCTARTSLRGPQGAPGVGVPPSGSTGQVLKKASDADYDAIWADESGGGGTGITGEQISAIIGLFQIAAYSSDPTSAYAALLAAFPIFQDGSTLTVNGGVTAAQEGSVLTLT